MSAPKAQAKIKYKKGKTEVLYESNLDASEYYIYELCRAALRDAGKFVCLKFREMYYQHFKKHTGDAGKITMYQVISGAKTTAPRVQIGIKAKRIKGFYAYFQEFGTSTGNVPRLGLLTKAVKDNVNEIVRIESQYLSGLSDEADRLAALVNEKEYGGDADGEDQ